MSKIKQKLQFGGPFVAPSRRFAFQSSVKKICLSKFRQEDLLFEAASFVFYNRQEDLPFDSNFVK